MAMLGFEINKRQPLAEGRSFGATGPYEQIDDAGNTTTAGEAGGTATPVNAGRSRRRRFDRGASR